MNTWFCSDYHLNHANIIKYCNRPFQDVEEMNRVIINNHNARVKKEDVVFFLGDFCFKNSKGGKKGEGGLQKAEHFVKQLNGRIVFVKGNHDRNNSLNTKIEKVVIRMGGYRICMIHNPAHADPSYKLNFCGHVHQEYVFMKLSNESDIVNLSADVWGFRPVNFNEIMKEYHKWKSKLK